MLSEACVEEQICFRKAEMIHSVVFREREFLILDAKHSFLKVNHIKMST